MPTPNSFSHRLARTSRSSLLDLRGLTLNDIRGLNHLGMRRSQQGPLHLTPVHPPATKLDTTPRCVKRLGKSSKDLDSSGKPHMAMCIAAKVRSLMMFGKSFEAEPVDTQQCKFRKNSQMPGTALDRSSSRPAWPMYTKDALNNNSPNKNSENVATLVIVLPLHKRVVNASYFVCRSSTLIFAKPAAKSPWYASDQKWAFALGCGVGLVMST